MVKHGDNSIGSLPDIESFIHKVRDLLGNVLEYDVNYQYTMIVAAVSYLAYVVRLHSIPQTLCTF